MSESGTALIPVGGLNGLERFDRVSQLLSENLGPDGLDRRALERFRVPNGGGKQWSIEGGMDDGGSVETLAGVILHWHDIRRFWENEFEDREEGERPRCWSQDAITGVGDPGGRCRICPYAEFGTAKKGRGQACRLARVLYFLRPGSLLPGTVEIPRSSVDKVKNFFTGCAGAELSYRQMTVKLDRKSVV